MFAMSIHVIRKGIALATMVAMLAAATGPARVIGGSVENPVPAGKFAIAGHLAAGDESSPAIESARQALNGRTKFPWYDSARDDLRRVPVASQKEANSSHRKSEWELGEINTPNVSWSFWGVLGKIARVLIYVLLAAIIIGLVTLLVRAFLNREERAAVASQIADDEDREGEIDRVNNLPFPVQRPRSDLLSEARRHYEEGNYGQAIIYLFSYELVQLDKHQFIRLTRGKTNRQYVREVRTRPPLRGLLEQTMVAFEDVFFGHHGLDRKRFEACWNQLDDFHQQLQQVPA